MEDSEHFQDSEDDIASVGKIHTKQEKINEKELNQLQDQMINKQGSPVNMNINVNLCSAKDSKTPMCNHNTDDNSVHDNVVVRDINISDTRSTMEVNQMSTLVAAVHRFQERKFIWNNPGLERKNHRWFQCF